MDQELKRASAQKGQAWLISPFLLAMLVAASGAMADSTRIAASEAINRVGQVATVCGHVASARYAQDTNGSPTFLNLDRPYPNQVFTAVIWGKDRAAFPYAPESLSGHQVCVAGKIQLYRDTPEIIVLAPSQIQTGG
jgi:hypothetical protein